RRGAHRGPDPGLARGRAGGGRDAQGIPPPGRARSAAARRRAPDARQPAGLPGAGRRRAGGRAHARRAGAGAAEPRRGPSGGRGGAPRRPARQRRRAARQGGGAHAREPPLGAAGGARRPAGGTAHDREHRRPAAGARRAAPLRGREALGVTEKQKNAGVRRTLDAASVTPLSEVHASGAPVAWGRLAILGPLAADRFGERFRAIDAELGREVVLHLRATSTGDDVREERFLDEARRLVKIHHPNALELLGADRRDGRLGYWSEPHEGSTLEELLAREGPFEAGEVRRIGLELCRALTAIHAVGIIHREVR